MATGLTFAFDPSKGDTPQSIARKRAIAAQLLGQNTGIPIRNNWDGIGSALASIGQGLASRAWNKQADSAEQVNNQRSQGIRDQFTQMLTGQPMGGGGSVESGSNLPATEQDGAPSSAGSVGLFGDLSGYYNATRRAESGGNDAAKNPNSSATGRYQFIQSTWDGLRKSRPDLGLTADGRLDPAQQERAMQAFTEDNARRLQGWDIPVTNGSLYAAHFLGAGGARNALTQPDNVPMAQVVGGDVIRANPFLGRMTVGDFRNWSEQKGGGGVQQRGGASGAMPSQPQPTAQQQPQIPLQMLQQVLSDPNMDEGTKQIALTMYNNQQQQQQFGQQQQAQRDNWLLQQNYQQNQQANDPKRNLEIRKLEQDLDRGQPLINAGAGRVYNPNTESWVEPPEGGSSGFRPATAEEAAKYGSQGGQFGPDGRFYPINPPSGTSLSVDPATGQVRFDQGAGVKPLTEGQSKDVVYSTRARGALENLGDLDTLLADPVSRAANYDPSGVIRGNVQSPDFQIAQNAGREFLQAVLRKDTGAAITKEETSEYGSVYLPVPGDSPQVIQQKRQARARAIAAMEAGMPPHAILQQEKALEKSSSVSASQTNDVSRSGVTRSGVRYERVD